MPLEIVLKFNDLKFLNIKINSATIVKTRTAKNIIVKNKKYTQESFVKGPK